MSTTVVPAPAVQAKRPVRSDKPANQTDEQQAVNKDEDRAARDDSEKHVSVASAKHASAPSADEHVGAGSEEVAAAQAIAKGEQVADADAPTSESAPATDTAMAGDFTFGGALAEAAATSGSLTSEAESADEVGFSQFGEDGGSTILLIGALALVGLGIYVLADNGGGGGDNNVAPTFDADTRTVTTNEDTPVTITPTATDADGGTLTYTATGATKGTVTVAANGALTYTPNANVNGVDTFTIKVTDDHGLTDTQAVTVNITAVNDPVSFNADSTTISVTEDTPFTSNLNGVLVDPDGDATISIVTQGQHGDVVLNSDGTYTYTPDANFAGTDSYVIKAADSGSSDTITVNVNVANVNDAPDFGVDDQTFSVAAGDTLEGILTATDPDDDDLTFGVATDPDHGTLTVADDGALTYTPDDGFLGTDMFTVNVDDGNGGTDTLDVTINVVADLVTNVNIDVPASGPAVTFDAADGDFRYNDNVDNRTDVIIQNFAEGDTIVVTGQMPMTTTSERRALTIFASPSTMVRTSRRSSSRT